MYFFEIGAGWHMHSLDVWALLAVDYIKRREANYMPVLRLLCLIMVLYLTSCGQFDGAGSTEVSKQAEAVIAPEFGWFDGRCFATMKNISEPQLQILVVGLDDPQSISYAKVAGPAKAETCGPLSSGRRERNESEGLKFYEVESEKPIGLAIGVIGKVYESNIKEGVVRLDLTGDGTFQQFTHCATGDGIGFDVWVTPPYEQKPVWTGFYYLDYDVDRNCP